MTKFLGAFVRNNVFANAEEALADLSTTFMPQLEAKYPGLRWAFEGAKKNSRDALGTLPIGFPMALFGIFMIIATIFLTSATTVGGLFTLIFSRDMQAQFLEPMAEAAAAGD